MATQTKANATKHRKKKEKALSKTPKLNVSGSNKQAISVTKLVNS